MRISAGCKVVYSGGVAGVFDENGNPSVLYGDLLTYYGNQEDALEAWSLTYTDEYSEVVGKTDSESSMEDVLRFATEYPTVESPVLSETDLNQVTTLMSTMGMSSLDDFTKEMNRLFKPNGIFEVDANRLFKSGVYSMDEIDSLPVAEIKGFLDKLNNSNVLTEQYSVPNKPTVRIKNPMGEKTIMGTYKTVSEDDLVEYLVRNSEGPTDTDYDLTFNNSDYSGITDVGIRARIYEKARTLRAIPKVFFDGTSFTTQNVSTANTLKNVLMAGVDPIELYSDVEVLEDISPTVWEANLDRVGRVLEGVEKTLMKYNVDAIGISEITDRDTVINILHAAEDMIAVPTLESIQTFATLKDSFVEPASPSVVMEIDPIYANRDIRYFESGISPDEVFSLSEMVKVGDNLYHAVDINVDETYNYLSQQYREGILGIPVGYIAEGSPSEGQILEGIKNFINTRDVGFRVSSAENQEKISLAQVAFRHARLQEKMTPPPVENTGYLTTDFVGDFYRFILEEKQKNSDLYDKTLKYFSIGDGDINLNSLTLPDITGMRFEQELRNYAALKKEGYIKNLALPQTEVNEGIEMVNDPSKAKEMPEGTFMVHDAENIIAKNVGTTYANVNGTLFRKVVEDLDGNSLFRKVNVNTDNVYFDANLDFSTNTREARSILKSYAGIIQTPMEYEAKVVGEDIKMSTTEVAPEINGRIITQEVIDRLSENGLAQNVFTTQEELREYLSTKGSSNVNFIIDENNIQIGPKVKLKASQYDIKRDFMEGTMGIPVEDFLDVTALQELQPGIDFSNTKINFEYVTIPLTNNISTTLDIDGAKVNSITFRYNDIGRQAETGYLRNYVALTIMHEAQHIFDTNASRSNGTTPGRVLSQISGKFGDISSRIVPQTYPTGEKRIDEASGVAYGIYLANDGEQRARKNTLQESKLPIGLYSVYETNIDEDLVWETFDEIKPENFQRYYDLTMKQWLGTRDLANYNFLKTPNGTVYGFTTPENDVYVDLEEMSNKDLDKTFLHEYAHLYIKNLSPELRQKGLDLVRGSIYEEEVKNNPNYKESQLGEEALVRAIADEGVRLRDNFRGRFAAWLDQFFDAIKNSLGLSNYTSAQVKKMTLRDYSQAAAIEMMTGLNLQKPQDFQIAAENNIVIERKYTATQEDQIKDQYDDCRT